MMMVGFEAFSTRNGVEDDDGDHHEDNVDCGNGDDHQNCGDGDDENGNNHGGDKLSVGIADKTMMRMMRVLLMTLIITMPV